MYGFGTGFNWNLNPNLFRVCLLQLCLFVCLFVCLFASTFDFEKGGEMGANRDLPTYPSHPTKGRDREHHDPGQAPHTPQTTQTRKPFIPKKNPPENVNSLADRGTSPTYNPTISPTQNYSRFGATANKASKVAVDVSLNHSITTTVFWNSCAISY